jgi:hypothetical protein
MSELLEESSHDSGRKTLRALPDDVCALQEAAPLRQNVL